MRARGYRPLGASSVLGWAFRVVLRPLVRRRSLALDPEGRSRDEFVSDALKQTFGESPDMEVRKHMVALPALAGLLGGAALAVAGVLVGLGLGAVLDGSVGSAAARVLAALSGPLWGLGLFWCYRWFMNDRDYASWVRAGRPAGWVPRASSQWGARDLILSLPLMAAFTYFFVNV